MQQQMTLTRTHPHTRVHQAEPTYGSFGATGGDLFSLDHYPAYGICRVCGGSIVADPYLRTFKHES